MNVCCRWCVSKCKKIKRISAATFNHHFNLFVLFISDDWTKMLILPNDVIFYLKKWFFQPFYCIQSHFIFIFWKMILSLAARLNYNNFWIFRERSNARCAIEHFAVQNVARSMSRACITTVKFWKRKINETAHYAVDIHLWILCCRTIFNLFCTCANVTCHCGAISV